MALEIQNGGGNCLEWQHVAMEKLWILRPPNFIPCGNRHHFFLNLAKFVAGDEEF